MEGYLDFVQALHRQIGGKRQREFKCILVRKAPVVVLVKRPVKIS